jgi:hypothetical protein
MLSYACMIHEERQCVSTMIEMSGSGLKAYLRHTAANQPRPAVMNLAIVVLLN